MIKQLNPIEKEIARRSSTSGTYSFSFQGSNKKTKNLRSGLPKVLTLHMYIFCLFVYVFVLPPPSAESSLVHNLKHLTHNKRPRMEDVESEVDH